MNLRSVGLRRRTLTLAVAILLTLAAIRALSDDPEIALVIGEPYEAMRQRSTASIAPTIAGEVSFNIPTSDARLRFVDPQYGFVTPLARFFAVIYRNEHINSVRMSPQTEPLLLDDTLKIVRDLQEQWRKGGWTPNRVKDFPSFADSPEWRDRLKDVNRGGTAYWLAGEKYQTMLVVSRFRDEKRPTEERYLITLGISKSRGPR